MTNGFRRHSRHRRHHDIGTFELQGKRTKDIGNLRLNGAIHDIGNLRLNGAIHDIGTFELQGLIHDSGNLMSSMSIAIFAQGVSPVQNIIREDAEDDKWNSLE